MRSTFIHFVCCEKPQPREQCVFYVCVRASVYNHRFLSLVCLIHHHHHLPLPLFSFPEINKLTNETDQTHEQNGNGDKTENRMRDHKCICEYISSFIAYTRIKLWFHLISSEPHDNCSVLNSTTTTSTKIKWKLLSCNGTKTTKKYTPYVQIICQINNIDFKAQHSNNLFLVSWTRTFVEPHKHIAHTQSTKPKSKQNIAKKNRLHVLVFMFVCWESEH